MNPLIALAVFAMTATSDALYAMWTIAITEHRPAIASVTSSAIYLLGATSVLVYVDNRWYLVPVVAGAAFGTWAVLTVRGWRKKKASTSPRVW